MLTFEMQHSLDYSPILKQTVDHKTADMVFSIMLLSHLFCPLRSLVPEVDIKKRNFHPYRHHHIPALRPVGATQHSGRFGSTLLGCQSVW